MSACKTEKSCDLAVELENLRSVTRLEVVVTEHVTEQIRQVRLES